jgi:hypothetical protein
MMEENKNSIITTDPPTLPLEIGIYIAWGESPILVYAEIDEMEGIYHQVVAENIDWAEKTCIIEEA